MNVWMSSLLLDFLQVSRPGWWLVSLWLYIAPYGKQENPDWKGLIFVCLPLNAFLYAMNDNADHHCDVTSPRKGNWVFGPKGWAKERIRQVLGLACGLTVITLLFWGIESGQPFRYMLWFIVGVVINMLYNSGSIQSPWELVLVYLGFGMVTILGNWRKKGSESSSLLSILYREGTWHMAGCNEQYWIYLLFLITRSQLWTEYMDYDSDRLCKKWTTLSRISTKNQAKCVVVVILFGEAVWTCFNFMLDVDWIFLAAFSVMGLGIFLALECGIKTISQKELIAMALLQSIGCIYLLYDTWSSGLFVK